MEWMNVERDVNGNRELGLETTLSFFFFFFER